MHTCVYYTTVYGPGCPLSEAVAVVQFWMYAHSLESMCTCSAIKDKCTTNNYILASSYTNEASFWSIYTVETR